MLFFFSSSCTHGLCAHAQVQPKKPTAPAAEGPVLSEVLEEDDCLVVENSGEGSVATGKKRPTSEEADGGAEKKART